MLDGLVHTSMNVLMLTFINVTMLTGVLSRPGLLYRAALEGASYSLLAGLQRMLQLGRGEAARSYLLCFCMCCCQPDLCFIDCALRAQQPWCVQGQR